MKKKILVYILSSCLALASFGQVNYQWVKGVTTSSASNDFGKSIVTDNSGNVYVAGTLGLSTNSVNFNPYGTNPLPPVSNALGTSCFFAKYGSDGNCVWARNIQAQLPGGVAKFVAGTGIAVDGQSYIYITGVFIDSANFNLGSGSNVLTSAGGIDCFLAKYDQSGTLQWVKQFGGSGDDFSTGIAVDSISGTVNISGYYNSANATFKSPVSLDLLVSCAGGTDVFIAQYYADGTFHWAKSMGDEGNDIASGIAVESSSGYVTLTGAFQDSLIINPGFTPSDTLIALGQTDAFFIKFLSDGSVGWAKNVGGSNGIAAGVGIAVDQNYVYLTGGFKQTVDLDPDVSAYSIASVGRDVFFAKYNLSDGSLSWGDKLLSSVSTDSITVSDITIDAGGNLFLTGAFLGTVDFDPTPTDNILISGGHQDVFFAKYTNNGGFTWAKRVGRLKEDVSWGIAVDPINNVYITGSFEDTVNFDIGIDQAIRTNPHGFGGDIFIAKYSEGTATIKGIVTYGNNNTPLSLLNNKAKLYTQISNDGNAAMHLVKEVDIDQILGSYEFSNIPAGTYYVLAQANSTDFPNVAPTYYGDTTHWQGAQPIIVLPDSTAIKNINMIQYTLLTGSATLSGFVLENNGFDRKQGDPIPGRDIVLEGDPGSSIKAHAETDAFGYYEFTNVPAGCYKIYVNIPGLTMDSTYRECPTTIDSIINLNFVADSNSIDINPISTGITDNQKQFNIISTVYPNPHTGKVFVEVFVQKESSVNIELYSILGEKVMVLSDRTVKPGKTKIEVNTNEKNIPSGIYFLKVLVDNKGVATKKIVQLD